MKELFLGCAEDLAALVEEWGMVPFFRNAVEGFSVEEHTPPRLWFGEEAGPWEWKGPVIRLSHCAYGKFCRGKAMYISKELFFDFANYRRDGYDFDARADEGLVRGRDREIMEEFGRVPSYLSKDLKSLVCFTPERKREFDGVMTRLQMQTYVTIADFEYARDRHGREYGWGIARYTTPEAFFGDFAARAYKREPEESYALLESHLKKLLPRATPAQIRGILG